MSDEVRDSGIYVSPHGLSVDDLRVLASWHRGLARQLRARGLDDAGDVKAAVFQLRISSALTAYADALEAGRGQRLQIKFEAVLTQGGIDPKHEPREEE